MADPFDVSVHGTDVLVLNTKDAVLFNVSVEVATDLGPSNRVFVTALAPGSELRVRRGASHRTKVVLRWVNAWGTKRSDSVLV